MSLVIKFTPDTFTNSPKTNHELSHIARTLRTDVVKSLYLAKSGHSGGSLDLSEIMTVLYFNGFLKYNSKNWKDKSRDRFVLSAGHLAPILYSTLARAGFFEVEELGTLRKLGTRLQGHPGLDTNLPGIETSAGSLGQGISIAIGMAMSHKYLDKTSQKVICITGDGELEEGTVWEAAMASSNFKLSNLCWIVDNNDCQIDGRVSEVMNIYPLREKFEAFGFDVIEIDGHNFDDIKMALSKYEANLKNTDKPTCIIAKTYMGKGVSFMENKYEWHGNPPNKDQTIQALNELEL
ncbi:MAG: hypothetical protein A2X64_10675 [Ignavibacteria bacterium GWF2_33_9]|nr:MAG: hypothetical protein A2X64_10675 [Ignavibacteria bacterium GWF2_33_9]